MGVSQMAGMAGGHRTAARLRHVANEQSRPFLGGRRFLGQALQQRDQIGMTPIAITREAHHLPAGPIDGERLAAREATLGVPANGPSLEGRGGRDRAEQLLRARDGLLGLLIGLLFRVLRLGLAGILLGSVLFGIRSCLRRLGCSFGGFRRGLGLCCLRAGFDGLFVR
jgi:hypothetical protein